MDTAHILSELRSERDRLDSAIAALEALDLSDDNSNSSDGRGYKFSAATRRRMSERMKERWARRKRAESKSS